MNLNADCTMLSSTMRKLVFFILVERMVLRNKILALIVAHVVKTNQRNRNQRRRTARPYTMLTRIPGQVAHLNRLYFEPGSTSCLDNLRINRNTFGKLCYLLSELGGLRQQRYVSVEEQVAMFLLVLGHCKNQRVIKFDHHRSGQTVSHYVNLVLFELLKLHTIFLVTPKPVADDSTDPRWKWFKVNNNSIFFLT